MSALLQWTKLAGKTWQALNSQGDRGTDIETETLDYLDFQITRWHEKLPESLKLDAVSMCQGNSNEATFVQAVLSIRKAHLRNLIYRPVLQSQARISQHKEQSVTAMAISNETLQTLADLNRYTPFFRTNIIFFKHTLLTAFGNLLLAVVNDSTTNWEGARTGFDIALALIRQLSDRSRPLMRLWERLQGLRELQSKLTSLSDKEGLGDATARPLSFDDIFVDYSAVGGSIDGMGSPSQRADDPITREYISGLFDDPFEHGSFDFNLLG